MSAFKYRQESETPQGGVIQLNFPYPVALSVCPSLDKVVVAGARGEGQNRNNTSECLTENISEAETAATQPQAGAGDRQEQSRLGVSSSAGCEADPCSMG